VSNPPINDALLNKLEPCMNSQGELVAPITADISQPLQSQDAPQEGWNFDDVISLGDTALAPPIDCLYPATDDTGMLHEIISCGHVLKSTHDLARWSEKTGARRVNGQESLDAVTDLAINLEPNRGGRRKLINSDNNAADIVEPSEDISGLFNEAGGGKGGRRRNNNNNNNNKQQWRPVEGEGKSEVINCWPVLKSTHDQAQLSEKRGRNAVNKSETSNALDELASNQGQHQQKHQQHQPEEPSVILNSWPVLKSTHDMALPSEKRGPHAVNQSGGSSVLEEIIQNKGTQAGGSLQSGFDTQAGTHVQVDSSQ